MKCAIVEKEVNLPAAALQWLLSMEKDFTISQRRSLGRNGGLGNECRPGTLFLCQRSRSPYVFVCLDEKEYQKEHYGSRFFYRNRFMRGLCDKANVKPFGFHAIRHLTASTLYKLGYEVAAIQMILRHKSPGTTERYLRSIGMERVREALESLSSGVEEAEVIAFEKAFGSDDVGAK